eukprot:168527_1
MTIADAPPPPLQTPATPYLPFRRCKTLSNVTIIRDPELPRGWPSETAPPKTLTFSGRNPRSFMLAKATTENASFISKKSLAPSVLSDSPAHSRARGIAKDGAVVNFSGA